jgi:hypothetical protein
MMIDTVKVRVREAPTEEQLIEHWEQATHTHLKSNTTRVKFIYNSEPSAPLSLKATFYPEDYNGDPMIAIELSLPKAQHGVNWQLITDLDAVIAIVDDRLRRMPALPQIATIAEADLIRLDACYNYHVGDALPWYLRALGHLEYPRRQTVPFLGTGVEYPSGVSKTKFYDKRAETVHLRLDPHDYAPPGTLRHETTFHRSRHLRRALRTDDAITLATLDPEAVVDILRRDLAALGIAGCSFATRERALIDLSATYGNNRGLRLYGALCAFQERAKSDVATEVGIDQQSVCRLLREARQAGIAPAFSKAETLPPLEIIWPPGPETAHEILPPTDEPGGDR